MCLKAYFNWEIPGCHVYASSENKTTQYYKLLHKGLCQWATEMAGLKGGRRNCDIYKGSTEKMEESYLALTCKGNRNGIKIFSKTTFRTKSILRTSWGN